MIQKRNISTFAVGLCLSALIPLSASAAKTYNFNTYGMSDTDIALKNCLTKKYHLESRPKVQMK